MRQMPVSPVKMIGQIRAALATLLPAPAEHEMINHQLTATLEQVGQRFLTIRPFADIFLFDLDHLQLAPRRAKRIPLTRQLLFSRQSILPSDQPLSFRDDL